MGFRVSFIACKLLSPREVCSRLGLYLLPREVEPFEHPLALASLPTGWTIVASSDEFYIAEERLRGLSGGATVIGCQIVESINYAAAASYTNGQQDWMVIHNPETDPEDLQIFHTLPQEFAKVRLELFRKQRDEGDRDEVDFIFDIPIELVFKLTGYRHDRSRFSWGAPQFYSVTAQPPLL